MQSPFFCRVHNLCLYFMCNFMSGAKMRKSQPKGHLAWIWWTSSKCRAVFQWLVKCSWHSTHQWCLDQLCCFNLVSWFDKSRHVWQLCKCPILVTSFESVVKSMKLSIFSKIHGFFTIFLFCKQMSSRYQMSSIFGAFKSSGKRQK